MAKKLGALSVREIQASDVVALIEARSLTWGESNTLLIPAKCLFTHARSKRLINVNPCHGVMRSAFLGERPPKRQRLMLTREELHLLLNAGMRRRNALTIRILLATAVRCAESYKARWGHVDLGEARWHIPKSKTGAASSDQRQATEAINAACRLKASEVYLRATCASWFESNYCFTKMAYSKIAAAASLGSRPQ